MTALLLLLLTGAARAQPAKSAVGSVVRSKEWVVRRGKAREEEFIGDVRYESAGTKLSSDWALYRQEPKDWQARGRIFARREFPAGDALETRGDKAWYDEVSLRGRLEPVRGALVPLLHTPPQGEADRAEGEHLQWVGQSVAILTGRARGWGPRAEFWTDEARVDRTPTDKVLTLTGARSVLHLHSGGTDAAAMGDRIVAHDSPRSAVVAGRAFGWIIAQSTSAPKTGPTAERCGQGDRSEGPGPDERVTALLAPLGPGRASESEARFWDAEAAAYAARACPWGPRAEFWADEADYASTPERTLVLSGGRPVLRRMDGDRSGALKADRIVAVGASKTVVATGKVRGWIVFKSDAKRQEKRK